MAGRITLWGAGEILTNFFTGGTTLPTNFWLALCLKNAPTPYVSGSELDEPLVGSYARLKIPASTTHWDNSGQMQVLALSKDDSFPTALQNWGTLRYWALCDSQVGGYVYAIGNMAPITIRTGDTVQVFAGDLTISLGPFFTDKEL